jgi:hypothetical protein
MSAPGPHQEPVDRYLRRLPQAMPPAGLGDHIVDLHLARRARRRWIPLATAASLLLAVLVWQQTERGPEPGSAAPVLAKSPALIDLRSVDRRLQAAYLAGASEAELAGLWRARRVALAELESGLPTRERRQVRL